MENILKGLNDKQKEAVKALEGPVLVISGPGSGKTKCLTHRVAYLIANGIHPVNILAITFTNKAAEEMKGRIKTLLRDSSIKTLPEIGTFHAICSRILRKEIPILGYKSNFIIMDSGDQVSLVKKIMLDSEIDTKRYIPGAILNKISKLKTSLISAESYKPTDFFSKIVSKIYLKYQDELKKMNALDFDDLIVFTVKIFDKYPDVLKKYQHQWQYILVDEYQDTSNDQYMLVKALASKTQNLFAIGDDAQSIYAFRDADIRNILNFQKDYPEAKVILLEQNYRSTKNIITAAQNVISNNKNQISKTLWTDNQEGNKINVKEAINERAEAQFIVSQIDNYLSKGKDFKDFAVLYRTHAQSRVLEEAMISHGFPYQIVGGLKFYERREIKDILAYIKLAHNPSDKVSFERIYNVPTRGIGRVAFDKIIATDKANVIEAITATIDNTKRGTSLSSFASLLSDIRKHSEKRNLTSLIEYIIKKIDYENYLKTIDKNKDKDYESTEERMENIKELLTVAKKYDHLEKGEGMERFLEEVALIQGADEIKEAQQRITMMTMHSSKGLEFPIVFMVGMEEGLFPHSKSVFNPEEMEEERRLCYVAMTRAKEHLILTHTKYRSIFGTTESNLPSRFLGELPQHILDYELFSPEDDYEEKIFY